MDTQGFLVSTVITAADKNDREGLSKVLQKIKGKYKNLNLIWADMGYLGKKTQAMVETYGRRLMIVKRPAKWFWVPRNMDINQYLQSKGIDSSDDFKVLPKRWIVERTFAWLNQYRRLSKDYEYLTETSEATLLLAMSRTILKRLVKLIH